MSKKGNLWPLVSLILLLTLLTAATISGQADQNALFLPVVFRARPTYWVEWLRPVYSVADIAPHDDGYLVGATTESQFDSWLASLQRNGQINWHRELDGATVSAVQSATDGTITLAGRTISSVTNSTDLLLMQVDKQGNIVWQKSAGGAEYDAAHAVLATGDGILVAGEAISFSSDPVDIDLWLVRFTNAGEIDWQKAYGDTGSSETALGLLGTSDGGILVVGRKSSEGWLLKLDENGTVIWEKRVETQFGSVGDELYAAQETPDGGFLIAGQLQNGLALTAALLKIDKNGTLANSTLFGYPAEFNDIQPTPDGHYLAAGRSAGHAWIVKVNANGDPLWQKLYGNNGEGAEALTVDAGGSFALLGVACSFSSECTAWTLRLDANGNIPNCSLFNPMVVSQVTEMLSLQDTAVSVMTTTAVAQDTGLNLQESPVSVTTVCPDSARAACLDDEE